MNVKIKKNAKEVRAMAEKIGRPRKYEKVEEMEKEIERYFEKCDGEKEPYTMSGLALALGFDSRQSLLNYCDYSDDEDNDFLDTIKKAKMKCEVSVERGLLSGKYNSTGAIFNLKNNFGWKDKQEIEQTGEQDINVNIKVIDNEP